MKELWIGVVEVLTDAASGAGDTRAFTNVVTWASSATEYADSVKLVFAEYGWEIIGVENVRLIADQSDFIDEIAEIIERARVNPSACIYSTFHYYPSVPV